MRRHVPRGALGAEGVRDLLSGPSAWDLARSGTSSGFALPEERTEWMTVCAGKHLEVRAAAVIDIAESLGASAIRSFGVGTACLELAIKQARPGLRVLISDWGPETIRRLGAVFTEVDDVECVDFLRDDLQLGTDELVLLHRVDTDLNDDDWRNVFARLAAAGGRFVLVVPTEFITLRAVTAELGRRLLLKQRTFAGYLRSRTAFDRIWSASYRLVEERTVENVSFLLLEAKAA